MKRLLLLSLLVFLSLSAWSAQRSAEEALKVAREFMSEKTMTRSDADLQLVAVSGDLLPATRGIAGETAFYVFNQGMSGFVIVSGDDRMKPVLAYSDAGAFVTENLPANIRGWLENYYNLYVGLESSASVQPAVSSVLPSVATRGYAASLSPMLKVNWNQSAPYNNDCPMVGSERAVTGCVATAMAMVMQYHNYPVVCPSGRHSVSVSQPDGTSTDLVYFYTGKKFDWNNMLPNYETVEYTDAQAAAVADLMLACGVAVDMKYGVSSTGGSAAFSGSIATGMPTYLGYNTNMGFVYRMFFTSDEWINLIKNELNSGRPILYNGASKEVGHEFVLDGYDTQDLFHVNWGWGGFNNGYFELLTLEPSSTGIGGGSGQGGGYAYSQAMAIGTSPHALDYTSYFYIEGEIKANKTTFSKGESVVFTLSFYNMSTTFKKDGQVAAIAEKDGKQIELGTMTTAELAMNYGYRDAKFTLKPELDNGTYLLYLATKDVRESSWSRIRGVAGAVTQFVLTVKDGTYTLSPYNGGTDLDKMNGSVELVHNLYTGHNGHFKLKLKNENTTGEYYGNVGVLLASASAPENLISYLGDIPFLLKAGEQGELLITDSLITNLLTDDAHALLTAGNYVAYPAVTYGERISSVGSGLNVSVNVSTGNPILKIENPRLESTTIGPNEDLTFLADLSISGVGRVYDKTLAAVVFESGESSSSKMHFHSVFVEKDVPYSLVMKFNPMVGEGTHRVQFYQPTASGSYSNDAGSYIGGFNFVVSSMYSGIEDEVAVSDALVVLEQPVLDVLRFRLSDEPQQVIIYNVSAQMVMQADLKILAGSEYTLPVQQLTPGYYVLTVKTADGKLHKGKFIKK